MILFRKKRTKVIMQFKPFADGRQGAFIVEIIVWS